MNKTHTPKRQKVVLIAGPTASGKSALAVRLGQHLPSLVINSDSAQVYSDLQVLSARPSEDEKGGVPHHLFGYIDGETACSAARWAEDAKQALALAARDERLPILVGGTGLYMRTLLDGIAPVPEIDEALRAEIRALPVAEAHHLLQQHDPAAAERLNPADTTRVARALEVARGTGRTLADWQAQRVGGIQNAIDLVPLILLPPRDWLFERIERRFGVMVAGGAVDEVERLLERELDPALPVMRAIGVPEISGWLRGEISRAAMLELGTIATRQYGKRQYTWFSRQPPATWPVSNEKLDDSEIDRLAIKLRDEVLTV
ncbi:tRNA (adenosine(37)-N6)-dimethylallyltransferase MiaA [Sphingomonas sp. C3-2]|uniref:tRNA (adenosine(37)-N6)-dimethylallyltransferase MiaA n=1 Tax=Sphingomonas sp. C3-2 TaxID=3062169 RepID=UPI00294B861A|nr:tRNA (adenosine(37)-N6)-dimethylallyltransferase MiaA [Sphingomonas sp. C3-2]WOK36858.1 tRNA (adenosine(37)-N6)-dimethylallyltransferase MiaA [Sphingomonas sp. C3-2]